MTSLGRIDTNTPERVTEKAADQTVVPTARKKASKKKAPKAKATKRKKSLH